MGKLKTNALWYLIANVPMAVGGTAYMGLTSEESTLSKVFVIAIVCLNDLAWCTGTTLIIWEKMQEYFRYIFFVCGFYVAAISVSIFMMLYTDYPVLCIVLFVLNLFIWCGWLYDIFEKQMSIIKKTLMRACSSRYYRDHRAHMWFPIDTNAFEPYYKFGDMLCLKRVDISYDDLNNKGQRLVVEDSVGVLHLYIKGQEMLERDNVKAIYSIEDCVCDFRFYHNRAFTDCPKCFEYK